MKTESQKSSQVVTFDLLNVFEYFQTALAVCDFLDYNCHLSFDVFVQPHKVLASTNELLILELLQRVEIEGFYLFAGTSVHHNLRLV